MERQVHGVEVYGLEVGERSECAHWHSERDIVAIRFPCCDRYYACHECHDTDHEPQRWRRDQFEKLAILCGACGHEMSISDYFGCGDRCLKCQADFNPGCRLHHHLYFEV